MRKPFVETLTRLAEKDTSIYLLIGDVGFSFLESFFKKFPNQWKNVGASEQKMMGMAAGMANMGRKPYVYTMKNFILLRPHEQLRNDICFPSLNVKLFGVGGSAAYSFLGASHNLFPGEEDAILSTLPNITKHFPKTEEETEKIMLEEYRRVGPSYMAL